MGASKLFAALDVVPQKKQSGATGQATTGEAQETEVVRDGVEGDTGGHEEKVGAPYH